MYLKATNDLNISGFLNTSPAYLNSLSKLKNSGTYFGPTINVPQRSQSYPNLTLSTSSLNSSNSDNTKCDDVSPSSSEGSLKTCLKKKFDENIDQLISERAKFKRNKSVSFSESLESVCFFLKNENPKACNKEENKEFTIGETENSNKYMSNLTQITKNSLMAINGPPATSVSLLNNGPSKIVQLDTISIDSDLNLIIGTIITQNIAFEKSVVVRYTIDNWLSYTDISADFSRVIFPDTSNSIGIDCFTFVLTIPRVEAHTKEAPIERELEFCIRYTVNNGEHWDNNSGINYKYKIISFIEKKNKYIYQESSNNTFEDNSQNSYKSKHSSSSNFYSSTYLSYPASFSQTGGYNFLQSSTFNSYEAFPSKKNPNDVIKQSFSKPQDFKNHQQAKSSLNNTFMNNFICDMKKPKPLKFSEKPKLIEHPPSPVTNKPSPTPPISKKNGQNVVNHNYIFNSDVPFSSINPSEYFLYPSSILNQPSSIY
ncbi:hypothetical protein BB558_002657 [Smittium angustum]|uniref:CBM21 domain-containing protein n=1 Tax=Smittium angustum TaxID=133377 RepID=A0A2U1J849_SMIAN|nr:hypothetical protein BB558_002657 [Smittium angustum]